MTIEGVTRAARRGRSSCSPRRTRSSTRAPIRCPRRSSTASCCGSRVGYPSREDEWRDPRAAARAARGRGRARPGRRRAPRCARCSRRSRSVHVAESVGYYIVDVVRATRDAPERPGRREPARLARDAQARRAAGRRSTGATSSPRTTSRRSPCRRSRTGSRSGPSSGCSASGPRTSSRERLETVPTPPAEDVGPEPALTRSPRRSSPPTPASPASACSPRSSSAGPSSSRSARRSCSCSASGSSSPPIRTLRASRPLDRDRAARRRRDRRLELELRPRAAVERLETFCSSSRPGSRSPTGDNPVAIRLVPASSGRCTLRLRAERWGGYVSATSPSARATRSASSSATGRIRAARAAARSSRARRRCARLLRPRETQLFSGDEVSRGRGRGHRVRRPAAVRLRRPRPPRSTGGRAPAAASCG